MFNFLIKIIWLFSLAKLITSQEEKCADILIQTSYLYCDTCNITCAKDPNIFKYYHLSLKS